jgi:hypothetical protein
MKPAANQVAAALHKLLQYVKEGEDKSLFGLLLLFEQKVRKHGRLNPQLRIEKPVAVKLVDQRQSMTSKLTRFVE